MRVFDGKSLTRGCRCSRERVVSILQSIDPAALGEYATDGEVDMVCEFCNHTFWVRLDELGARA